MKYQIPSMNYLESAQVTRTTSTKYQVPEYQVPSTRVSEYQSTKYLSRVPSTKYVPVKSAGELGGIGGVWATAATLGSWEHLVDDDAC